jgi:hypothetical protein
MALAEGTREKLLKDVEKHGWLVLQIVDNNLPSYSYTVGLFKKFGHPEIVISGLDGDTAQDILNDIGHDIAKGIVREAEHTYDDILEDYPCLFKAVSASKYDDYFGRANLYYQSSDYPVLQCVLPDSEKRFPDDEGDVPDGQELLYRN